MRLLNTLSSTLEEVKFDSNVIKWYTCGPTIYNRSHLGHARTFIMFDIIRNYLESTGYNVIYAMNITDIDDKILNKVKLKHWHNLFWDIRHSMERWNNDGNEHELFADEWEEITGSKYNSSDPKYMDNLEFWLLKQERIPLNEKLLTPSYELYKEFIKEHEAYFWSDMDKIGVKQPDITMRVSDVIDKIIDFIQKLITNDMAYESNGSVYFDVNKYQKSYSRGLIKVCEDKSLHDPEFSSDKRDPKDFSLWKKAKKYEISFDSPWGKGRISWHSECSAMIYEIFGEKIDIHSGGFDLKFPHHHNEFLQTTAYTNNQDWVKYFFHSGYLNIDGNKMAQSAGNFIIIDEFLKKNNPRVLRLSFLMHQWHALMDYNENTIMQATELDNRIDTFMKHLNYINKSYNKINTKILDSDLEFLNKIMEFKNNCKSQFEDNFNTPNVIQEIRKLIAETYLYLETDFNINNVKKAELELIKIMEIFRLNYTLSASNDDSKVSELVDAISEIRDQLRGLPKKFKSEKDIKKEIFGLSDWIRDKKLPELGFKMEDLKDCTKTVKI